MKKLVNIFVIMAVLVQQLAYFAAYLHEQGLACMKGVWYYGNATTHLLLFAAIFSVVRYGYTRFTIFLIVGAAALPLNQWWDEIVGQPGKWGVLEWVAYVWLGLCLWASTLKFDTKR